MVSYNDSAVSIQLPYFPTDNSEFVSVQVVNETVSSNAPYLISYRSQLPYISFVTGCDGSTVDINYVRGCTAGDTINVLGGLFLPPPAFRLTLGLGFDRQWASNCTYYSSNNISCPMPTVPDVEACRFSGLQLTVTSGSLRSYRPGTLAYYVCPSSSSSSSTGAPSSGSRVSEASAELSAVLMAVVVVVVQQAASLRL